MAGTDFIDNFRSTFMGQRDQVKAERAAEKAEAKSQQAQVEAQKAQEEAQKAVNLQEMKTKISDFVKSLRDAINSKQQIEAAKTPEKVDDEYTVSYTYKPGDTFGQVITDLGLKTDSGLWGSNGDVAYYTAQLIDQGALDRNGNIPVGTTIRLRRRGAPEIKMSEEVTPDMGKITEEAKYPALQRVIRSGARKV